jgi:hypothetical protein
MKMRKRNRKKRMLTMLEMPPHLLPLHHHLQHPLLPCLPVAAIPEQEAPMPYEVILAEFEPEVPLLHLHHALLRDFEENPLRLEDDFDDLDDDPNEGLSDVDELFLEDGSNGRDWVIKSKP